MIRCRRDEGERERRLPVSVLSAMHEARLFRMYVPVVYGPPPPCKDFGSGPAKPALAVVYPALQRGSSTAGPDGFRGSAA